MTISAQTPGPAKINSALAERPTHGIGSGHRCPLDSFALLDHRTRERAIAVADAPPGRYLSIQSDRATYLIPLDRPITHVGRGLIADVRLEDAEVSRRHAILAIRGEGARVLDDRSSHGTFVNGHAVTVAQLADGDVLRFGRAVFRYTEIAAPGRPRSLRRVPPARSGPIPRSERIFRPGCRNGG